MRRILIVGAGQAGLQLGLSLLAEDYDVAITSARTSDQILAGPPLSTQIMFEPALATERAYNLNTWEWKAPPIAGSRMTMSGHHGERTFEFTAKLDHPARCIDQRIKISRWLQIVEHLGATVLHRTVTAQHLDNLTAGGRFDLVLVDSGDLASVFDPDPVRTVYDSPQRRLVAAYVHGLDPDPQWPAPHAEFHRVPGAGDLSVIPALTETGPCHILLCSVIPDGPADRWTAATISDDQVLSDILDLIQQLTPWVAARASQVALTDSRATMRAFVTPGVRRPVAHLPSGGIALGIGDVVITNDPIAGQDANTAAKAAAAYAEAIIARRAEPFDEAWMTDTFEAFWRAHGSAATTLSNAMLRPTPAYLQQILDAAAEHPAVAGRIANGLADPTDLVNWLTSPAAAHLATQPVQRDALAGPGAAGRSWPLNWRRRSRRDLRHPPTSGRNRL